MKRIFFVFLAICCAQAFSGPLVGVDGSSDGAQAISTTQTYAVGWQFNTAFSDLQIRANLRNDMVDESPVPNFTAYLMSAIGTGASEYNQIDRYDGTLDPLADGWVTLFDGLTLPVGTYYLVLATDQVNSSLGWNFSYYPTALYEALPSAWRGDGTGYQWYGDPSGPADPLYPPSWAANVSNPDADGYLLFDVSTPEPSSIVLILFGLPVLVHLGRRRLA